jgi:hypothetical protein
MAQDPTLGAPQKLRYTPSKMGQLFFRSPKPRESHRCSAELACRGKSRRLKAAQRALFSALGARMRRDIRRITSDS